MEMEGGSTTTETTTAPGAVSPERSMNDKIADVVKARVKEFSEETPKKEDSDKPFVSDKGEPEKQAPKPEEKEVKEAPKDEKPEPIKPPRSWTKQEKAEFEKLPDAAKKAILRSEGEKDSQIGKWTTEYDKITKATKEAVDNDTYLKEVAKKVGAPNVRHFLERMVEAQEQSVKDPVSFISRITDHNPVGYVKALMERYNIDVRALASGRDDLAFDDYTHKQQTELQRIQAENAEMRRYFQDQQQYQQQSQAQQHEAQTLGAINDALNQFYADKSEVEQDAAIPYIQHAVRVVIAEAQERGEQIQSYSELIRKAHAKALRLNDSYQPVTSQQPDYARSRAVSPGSRGGASTGVPTDGKLSGSNFNDLTAQIVRRNLKKYF